MKNVILASYIDYRFYIDIQADKFDQKARISRGTDLIKFHYSGDIEFQNHAQLSTQIS